MADIFDDIFDTINTLGDSFTEEVTIENFFDFSSNMLHSVLWGKDNPAIDSSYGSKIEKSYTDLSDPDSPYYGLEEEPSPEDIASAFQKRIDQKEILNSVDIKDYYYQWIERLRPMEVEKDV